MVARFLLFLELLLLLLLGLHRLDLFLFNDQRLIGRLWILGAEAGEVVAPRCGKDDDEVLDLVVLDALSLEGDGLELRQ